MTYIIQYFMLTTSIDQGAAFVGTPGNDTFNAALDDGAMTFTSLDAIDGGAGSDTLNIVSDGSLAGATGASVKSVETVNLISSSAITAANVTGFTGLETLNVTSSSNIAGVNAAATTNVNVLNGLGNVAVEGGKNVVVNTSGGDIAVGTTTGAAGNVTATNSHAGGIIDLKGAGVLTATAKSGGIEFINGTSVNATASQAVAASVVAANKLAQTAATAAATAATGNDDASGKARTVAADKVTALSILATAITNATNSTVGEALSIQAATNTAFLANAITRAEKIAIDTAFAGAATVAAGKTAAQAVLTPLQTAATAANTAAIAADVVNDAQAAAAKVAADAAVAADDAKADLVKNVDVTAVDNTALVSASIKGNYGVTNNDIQDGSVLANTLTTVTLENAGNTTITGKAVAQVNATGQSANVTVINSTADHTQNYTLSGITAGVYKNDKAATVNIVSNGTATNVLSGLDSVLATKVNLSGEAGLTFGFTVLAAAAVIDASKNSGANSISIAAGQRYVGGSGKDTVTAGNALQTATVDGGAGTSDTLVLTNTAAFATTGAARFQNFEVLETSVAVDVSKFTASSIGSVIMSGTTAVTGLTAAQAANVTIKANSAPTIGVTGATTVGQLDAVTLTVDDGLAAVNTIILTAPVLAGVETLNLVANDNVTLTGLTSASALTNVNVTGTGTVGFTSDALSLNVNTVVDASAVNKAVTLNFAAAIANGISLKAGDGNNVLTGTSIAGKGNLITSGHGNSTLTGGVANDVITAGNGNNTIDGGAGDNTITAGDGNNTVTVSAGANAIKLGNGWNVVNGGTGVDTITVGTGANVIDAGTGADAIVLGASVAGTGNTIKIDALDTGITVALADKITGFTTGADKLKLSVAATALNYVEATAAVADFAAALTAANAVFAAGTAEYVFQFDGTNGYLFIDRAANADAADEVIVLVGVTNAGIALTDIMA
jgi:hypothetical protein